MEELKKQLEQAKAYAEELEGIIRDVKLDTEARILVDYLVGKAKQKYNQV